MDHWTATAMQADRPPGELERLLGLLIAHEGALPRLRQAGLYLDPRQKVLAVKGADGATERRAES